MGEGKGLERVRLKMERFRGLTLLVVAALLIGSQVGAVQIVTESPNVACEELQLAKELRIYKDPTLFLANLGMIYADPTQGWESLMEESPLLTTVKGRVQVMRLGKAREFRNFGGISRLYESVDPRLKAPKKRMGTKGPELLNPTMIIPIKVCGGAYDAYKDSLGFVVATDLRDAQQEEYEDGQMPPSTVGNPIPKLRAN